MKIKNGQYINALKKLSNQHKLNPLFCPIKLSVILSVTDFYFVSFQSTTPPWLLPMYTYIQMSTTVLLSCSSVTFLCMWCW